jgi:hypothetical protein
MTKLSNKFMADNKKAHTENGMDLLRLLTSYEQANREQLKQHQTVSNLNKILDDDKFYYVNDDITFKGEIKRTTNSIVTILCNVAGEPSNLAIYPLDGSKPFLLNPYSYDDAFTIGCGGELVAITDIKETCEIYQCLNFDDRESRTFIIPFNEREFDSLVKAHATHHQVTIYTNFLQINEQLKKFKGHKVKLIAIRESLLSDIGRHTTLEQIEKDEDNKVEVLDGFEWGNPRPISQKLPAVKTITNDMLPKSLYDYTFDNANRLNVALEFIAIPLVVGLGSVIGTKVSILPKKHDDWENIANFWGGIIGNPSSKKTPSLNVGLKPLENLKIKAKKDFENANKNYNAQNLVNAEREKADKERLKELIKKQSKQKDDSKDKVSEQQIQDLALGIATLSENIPNPTLRRYVTDDSSYEKLGDLESQNPNGILIKRDELTGLLSLLDKDENQQARSFYLEGFNGNGSYTFDRMTRGTVFIENHCLSLVGGIQPDKLEFYLSHVIKGLNNDGLMQRFSLLVYPNSLPNSKEKDLPVNTEIRDIVYRIFELLDGLTIDQLIKYGANEPNNHIRRPHFRLSEDAYPLFMNCYDGLKVKADTAEHSIIAEHLMKYPKTLASLALIFHLVDCVEQNAPLGPVSKQALLASIKWIEFLETHMMRIYSTITDNAQIKASLLSVKILEIIKNQNKTPNDWLTSGFTARQVMRKCWKGLTDNDDVQTAIDVLVDHEWLKWESIPTTGQGGRPTERYYINPKIKQFIK